jgi:hypothetical protein
MNGKVFLLTMILAGASADATPAFESTSSDIFDGPEGVGRRNRHSMAGYSESVPFEATTIPIVVNTTGIVVVRLPFLPWRPFQEDEERPLGGLDESDVL